MIQSGRVVTSDSDTWLTPRRFGVPIDPAKNTATTIDAFITRLHATPFEPFEIRMADGRSFPSEHPDFVARPPSGRTTRPRRP